MDTPNTYESEMKDLVAMRAGVEWRGLISLRDFTLSIRPLTMNETLNIATSVAQEMLKMPMGQRSQLMEHTMVAKETLKRASNLDPTSYSPGVADPTLDNMTPDELSYLFKQYVAHTDRVNPAIETMPEGRLHQLVDALKKTPQSEWDSQLIELSLLDLVSLVRYFLTKGD